MAAATRLSLSPLLHLLLLSLLANGGFLLVCSTTDPNDAAVLRSLKDQWENTPMSWDESDDPCDGWEGVSCNGTRVTALGLSTMGLTGQLSGDIGELSQLRSLDLSFNRDLKGSISPSLGELSNLNILILAGCGFTGSIPKELGKLSELSFLALNSNYLSGKIPPALGNLSKVYWFDVADNQLTGPIPVSTDSSPGLDLLLHAKHFHMNKNKLSGTISPKLFKSEMKLIHILFDGNQLEGSIPSTLGLVTTVEVLRLDRNQLTGDVPLNLNNLTNLSELNLGRNQLTGPLPDLTGLDNLNYLDLSHNSFDESETPEWFSTLESLTTLMIENGSIKGPLPKTLFSFPQLQQVKLKNNGFNGTLDMGDSVSEQLELVDLENNDISSAVLGSSYKNTLILIGNPACTTSQLSSLDSCAAEPQFKTPYSTSLASCGARTCSNQDQKLSPQSCECSYPYEGTFYFRGPSFRELSNATIFRSLEMDLWKKLGLTPGSVSLQNPFFNTDDYLQVHLALFPSPLTYFNRSEVLKIGFDLSNQTYKPPHGFGPYYFIASPYVFQEGNGGSMSLKLILGLSICGGMLIIFLVGFAVYAVWQKKRAEKAIELSKPFASWTSGGKNSDGGAPQLKGARWFPYDELKKCTANFSSSNVIGSGGYGKVYRGTLPDGKLVAVKRAQQGSMQGGLEFKTEIELLSRVHHKNLVGLVGFSFEQGEQMLVYEFMPNGSLRDSLSGRSGIYLDWKRRLRIALGSARGLTYLHELANPTIIHRDVKSTNILLDESLNAKVSDFGLSKLVSDGGQTHISTQVKGTLGYLDPEYYLSRQLTEKSDVYSFGVVMLELLTSKQPLEKGKYVVREAKTNLDMKDHQFYGLRSMLDPVLITGSSMNLTGFGRYVELALKCVEESASDRPAMSEVLKVIELILENDGIGTNSTASAASSINDFGGVKGATNKKSHLYDSQEVQQQQKKDVVSSGSGDAFDYSGGYSVSAEVEPK